MARLNSNSATNPAESAQPTGDPHAVFALDNVSQLRQAVDQAVYGEADPDATNQDERERTVEGLTTLGQMGLLTETDIDEAKKGYL